MLFGADELRVLRRALALVLQPASAPARVPAPDADGRRSGAGPAARPDERPDERPEEWAEAVRECLWLAGALDEAVREADRLRAFLLADLGRYRAALPGSASGYLARLEEALALGCPPHPEDLEALQDLCAEPAGAAEAERRAGLLRRCELSAGPPGSGRPAAVPRAEPHSEPRREPHRAARPGPVPTPADVFPPRRREARPSRRALPA